MKPLHAGHAYAASLDTTIAPKTVFRPVSFMPCLQTHTSACAQDTRLAEIDNVTEWALGLSNNLTFNTSKTKEIVF